MNVQHKDILPVRLQAGCGEFHRRALRGGWPMFRQIDTAPVAYARLSVSSIGARFQTSGTGRGTRFQNFVTGRGARFQNFVTGSRGTRFQNFGTGRGVGKRLVAAAGGNAVPFPVGKLPAEIAVFRHILAAQRLAVFVEFDAAAVGIYPYFSAGIAAYMQARLGSPPPGLEVVGLVLRETAVVENAELRTGRRPYHRVGLSAIVEAGPVEKTCRPAVLLVEFPSSGYAVHHSSRIGPVQRQH